MVLTYMMPPRMSQDDVIKALEKLALEHHANRKQRCMYQDYYTYSPSPAVGIIYSKIAIISQKIQRIIKFLLLNLFSINRKSG